MANNYPTGSFKQSGGNILKKWLSDQRKFSAIRVGQKLQNSNKWPCSLNRYKYRVHNYMDLPTLFFWQALQYLGLK